MTIEPLQLRTFLVILAKILAISINKPNFVTKMGALLGTYPISPTTASIFESMIFQFFSIWTIASLQGMTIQLDPS